MKKSVCVPALLLAAVCLLCGCTSREEKLAAAREAARLEAVETARAAVDAYAEAADAYDRQAEPFNQQVEAVRAANAAFAAELDALQARLDSEPIPYEPETRTALETALEAGRAALREDPELLETAELLTVDDALSAEEAASLAAHAEAAAQTLRDSVLPAAPEMPDYSDQRAALQEALESYEASLEIILRVTAPTDEYVGERLMTVDTIAATNAVTEGHDPNGSLGQSGGYIGCVFFRDSRISVWNFRLNPGADRNDPVDVGTQGGGCVEIYATQKEAENRLTYLDRFKHQIGAYDAIGSLVIRCSDELSAEKQRELLEQIELALLALPEETQN